MGRLAAYVIFISIADWIARATNLDLRSASIIFFGALLLIMLLVCAFYYGVNKRALAPWMVVLVAPVFAPALTYWASAGPGPFHLRGVDQNMAWFGNGWWQLLMWCVLIVGAYLCNKLADEWIWDW
jgi:hypothetical protein